MKTYILYIDKSLSIEYAEECKESCQKFDINPIMHSGLHGIQNRELTRRTGYNILTTDYASEYCGTVGHIQIWKKIAESNEVGVILEHDSIVMADYSNLTVEDGEILFLGPRIFNRADYSFPENVSIDYYDVPFYNGAHAYAITPGTAKMLLDELDRIKRIIMPIDGLLGLRNTFNMKLRTIDPAFVVSEIGAHRKSFNFEKPDVTNRKYYPKFLSGVSEKENLPPTVEYKFTLDMFSRHIPHWEKTFEIAGKDFSKPTRILEVGSYEGMSTTWISDHLLIPLESRMDTIDTFEDWVEHPGEPEERLQKLYFRNLALSRNGNKIKTHVGDSRIYLPSFIAEERKYDFIYIDGNHTIDNVIVDGLCAFNLLKTDGVIIFDDYEWIHNEKQPVKIALDTLEKILPLKCIVDGYQRSYMKI